jgi:hypothetical protein
MSHYYLKTKWREVCYPYGNVEEHVLYAHHNLSCDTVTIYDGKGQYIIDYNDTDDNNLFDAMKRLDRPWQRSQVLEEGVDYMTPEELKLCGL